MWYYLHWGMPFIFSEHYREIVISYSMVEVTYESYSMYFQVDLVRIWCKGVSRDCDIRTCLRLKRIQRSEVTQENPADTLKLHITQHSRIAALRLLCRQECFRKDDSGYKLAHLSELRLFRWALRFPGGAWKDDKPLQIRFDLRAMGKQYKELGEARYIL